MCQASAIMAFLLRVLLLAIKLNTVSQSCRSNCLTATGAFEVCSMGNTAIMIFLPSGENLSSKVVKNSGENCLTKRFIAFVEFNVLRIRLAGIVAVLFCQASSSVCSRFLPFESCIDQSKRPVFKK